MKELNLKKDYFSSTSKIKKVPPPGAYCIKICVKVVKSGVVIIVIEKKRFPLLPDRSKFDLLTQKVWKNRAHLSALEISGRLPVRGGAEK